MIEVRHLTKFYGSHRGIEDVSFEAGTGEILGFLGPNGAGKTTAMRILTCYLPPTAGEARVAGYDVMNQSIEVRRRIGYLPENVPLYLDLSVTEYLDYVARLKGMPRSAIRRRIDGVMDECGIDHVRHRTIGKLSKGYRQRVGLAQALVNDPEVLILDEPTVGLDPRQIVEIRDLIRSLAGRRTVILSTHILPEASHLCNRVIIINEGKLVTIDTPDNLKSRLQSSMVIALTLRGEEEPLRRFLESLPDISAVSFLDSIDPGTHTYRVESRDNKDIREALSRSIVEAGIGLVEINTSGLSLEDIFVKLVTQEAID